MTSDFLHPGVYVEELPTGVRTIPGVPTSGTAFVGLTSDGETCRALHIASFGEFEQLFGRLSSNYDLGYAVQQFFLNRGKEAWVVSVAQQLTSVTIVKGIQALDAVDTFNLLVLPGVENPEAWMAAADYCQRRHAFLILDVPKSMQTPPQIVQAVHNGTLPNTSYTAVYFPWINVPDSSNIGQLRLTPPTGSIAGLFARIDSSQGVWKAPAGTGANLVGVSRLQYVLSDSESASLNALGVNCLRIFRGGTVVWGARTLERSQESTSDWKYIPVRRLALFIEKSLHDGTEWAVFEPNDRPLWTQIRLNAEVFLHSLFSQGAFAGNTPDNSYFVRCDASTNSQKDIDAGVVNVVVGFAPVRRAEFITLTISMKAGRRN